jgi:hypothetical protein
LQEQELSEQLAGVQELAGALKREKRELEQRVEVCRCSQPELPTLHKQLYIFGHIM